MLIDIIAYRYSAFIMPNILYISCFLSLSLRVVALRLLCGRRGQLLARTLFWLLPQLTPLRGPKLIAGPAAFGRV